MRMAKSTPRLMSNEPRVADRVQHHSPGFEAHHAIHNAKESGQ